VVAGRGCFQREHLAHPQRYNARMTTRELVILTVAGLFVLIPASASGQSPFEEDDAGSPSPSTSTKDAPAQDHATPPPMATPTPARTRFRVLSSSKVTLQLRSPDPGAAFSILSGRSTGTVSTFGTSVSGGGWVSFSSTTGSIASASFDRVCTAPCTVEIDSGVQRWLLELPDGRSAATGPMVITRDATLEARYVSSDARLVFALLGTLSLSAGLVMHGVALDRQSSPTSALVWVGLGSELLGLLFFEAMGHESDGVEVREIPTRHLASPQR
jgi:hypothetical protein